jgi:hypothetical protein
MQRRASISQTQLGDLPTSSTASLLLSNSVGTPTGSRPLTAHRASVFARRRQSLVAEAAAAATQSASSSASMNTMSQIPDQDVDDNDEDDSSRHHQPIIPGLQTSGSASRLLAGIRSMKEADGLDSRNDDDNDSNPDDRSQDSDRDDVESDTETIPTSQLRRVETWGNTHAAPS